MTTKAGTMPAKRRTLLLDEIGSKVKSKVKTLLKRKKAKTKPQGKVFNRKTLKALDDIKKRKNIESFTSAEDMFRALGMRE